MQADRIIDRLKRFPPSLRATCAVFSPEDAAWKPDPASWSVLEIVCHLCDEETDDFRRRTLGTLADPTDPWPPIDPEGAAVKRRYAEQDLSERLDAFAGARAESVRLLRELAGPDWSLAYQHPKFGPIHAGEVFASWAAHDALHLRQIAKRAHQLAARDGGGFSLRYAGDW